MKPSLTGQTVFTLQTFSTPTLSLLADERLNFPGYFQAGCLASHSVDPGSVRRSAVGVSSFGSSGTSWWREAFGAVMPLGRPWPPSLVRHVFLCTRHSNSGKSVDGESTEVSSSNPLLQNLPPRALEVAVVVLRLAT